MNQRGDTRQSAMCTQNMPLAPFNELAQPRGRGPYLAGLELAQDRQGQEAQDAGQGCCSEEGREQEVEGEGPPDEAPRVRVRQQHGGQEGQDQQPRGGRARDGQHRLQHRVQAVLPLHAAPRHRLRRLLRAHLLLNLRQNLRGQPRPQACPLLPQLKLLPLATTLVRPASRGWLLFLRCPQLSVERRLRPSDVLV
jgi:hypothetical protein